MILRRVELGQFGKWTNRIFEFRRGANLVLGGNEAGKTTLATAIPAVLFGLRNKERFIPWEGAGGCEAALVWEDSQQFWRLERDLRTDEVALTVWHEGGEVLRSFSGHAEAGKPGGEYAQLLRELLGQDGGENVISGSFCPSIEEPVFPLPQGAYFRQSTERRDPSAVDPAPGEEILRVRRQLAELEERWYALRPATGQLKEVEEELAQVREALAVADSLAPISETEVPVVVARTEAPLPAAGELTSRRVRRRQLQEELARLGLPVSMSADLPLLLAEAEALRRELVSLQKEAVRIRETRATRPAPPWKVAVTASALPLLLGIIGSLWLAWGAVGWLGGALLAAVVWLVNGHYHGRHLAEDARYKGQAQAIEARREAAQEQLGAMDDRFRQMNISPSAVSLLKMQKNIERSRVIVDELHRQEGALAVLEGISSEETEVRDAMAPEAERSVAPAEPRSPEALALMERHRLLEQERERLQGCIGERQQIEKEGEGLRDQEAILARALKDPTLATGHGSEEHRQFADECARLLALLGGRRPYQVAVTAHHSLVMKQGPEAGWCSPFAFGHGASDLLGLAARLAADTEGRQLLLFDGGLAHLERARLAEVFGALERIALQRQVIVFCREDQLPKRLARERWQVVSLEEETISRERDDHAGQLHLL